MTNLLEETAFNYVEAKRALEGAQAASIPDRGLAGLRSNVSDALQALLEAAESHFNNVYDGPL